MLVQDTFETTIVHHTKAVVLLKQYFVIKTFLKSTKPISADQSKKDKCRPYTADLQMNWRGNAKACGFCLQNIE